MDSRRPPASFYKGYVRMATSLVTAATAQPVSIADVKDHVRITHDDQDARLDGYIKAATRYIENISDRQLMTATWRLSLDDFPTWELVLPKPPLQSVSSVQYVDGDGATQTWASSNYIVDTYSDPGRITPAYGKFWPSPRDQVNAVTIQFVAGYTSAANVPATIRQALLMLVAHWYENREAALVGTISKEIEFAVTDLVRGEEFGNMFGNITQ